jgi:hypothetical protein
LTTAVKKLLDTPDAVLDMDGGDIDVVEIGGGGVGGDSFEPGWKWSEHEKPYVGGGEQRRSFWRTDGGP